MMLDDGAVAMTYVEKVNPKHALNPIIIK